MINKKRAKNSFAFIFVLFSSTIYFAKIYITLLLHYATMMSYLITQLCKAIQRDHNYGNNLPKVSDSKFSGDDFHY